MLYFVDESGIDLREAPYLVLAGVGIPEREVWPFAQAFVGLKEEILRMSPSAVYEVKGTKLLNRRVFRQAQLRPSLPEEDRSRAVEIVLNDTRQGRNPTFYGLLALAQAKLEFVHRVLDLAGTFGMTIFASVVPRDAPQQRDRSFLRKDFAYLFQRIHCHVCDGHDHEHGVLIFDEQDPALSRSLLDQINRYFGETERGKQRASRMIPMPFFVHSELTPAIQLADLVGYIVNWGLRMPRMSAPMRDELKPYADKVFALRYQGKEVPTGKRRPAILRRHKPIWGIAYIEDLRPSGERVEDRELDLDETELALESVSSDA